VVAFTLYCEVPSQITIPAIDLLESWLLIGQRSRHFPQIFGIVGDDSTHSVLNEALERDWSLVQSRDGSYPVDPLAVAGCALAASQQSLPSDRGVELLYLSQGSVHISASRPAAQSESWTLETALHSATVRCSNAYRFFRHRSHDAS
jgi:hypothetical protein